jgi:hypothetical protein
MKLISRKARHGVAIVLAVAWMVVAVMAFADFSGKPAPRWREVSMKLGPAVVLAVIGLNRWLDGRDQRAGGVGRKVA